MEILYISYGEFFKVTCTAVQELYKSSLVCPLILIRRATFWSKRLVRTVLGSMLTGIWVFSMEILYIAMWILQGHLYGRTRTVQVKSGMSIDSHLESYVLVQTASPYSPGKYVNWNLSFFNGDPVYSYVNSSRSPVRPYKNCTGQVWYVHWFSSGELRFGPNGYSLTGIWVFSMEILYIAMWIFQGHLYGRTRTVQVKSGMSIDSHPESYVLVQTASPYSPGKYVNWNLSFFNGDPVYSYVNSSRSPVRPYKNCTGQVWYVHWFSSGELRFGPNG